MAATAARLQPKLTNPQMVHLFQFKPIADEDETEFDRECARLGLSGATERDLIQSVALRYWAMHNAFKRYVPTVLLAAWGIYVSEDFYWSKL